MLINIIIILIYYNYIGNNAHYISGLSVCLWGLGSPETVCYYSFKVILALFFIKPQNNI